MESAPASVLRLERPSATAMGMAMAIASALGSVPVSVPVSERASEQVSRSVLVTHSSPVPAKASSLRSKATASVVVSSSESALAPTTRELVKATLELGKVQVSASAVGSSPEPSRAPLRVPA
jgi:hypothetical protein